MIRCQIDLRSLHKKMQQVPRELPGIMKKAIETDARGSMLDIIAITPPGSEGALLKSGKKGEGAIERGRAAIRRDLLGGRKRAGIFMALDDGLINSALNTGLYQTENVRLFVKKDGTVYGTERSLFRPDASIAEMDAHHHKYWKNGRMTSAGSRDRTIGRWRFVDKMVVRKSTMESYLNYLYDRIGIMAGGWGKGAKRVGAKLPKIVKKHASGACKITLTKTSFSIEITNAVTYFRMADMSRRIQFVLNSGKRQKRVQNSIRYQIRAVLRAAKLSA